MAEEHRCQAPTLCVNNCGFFGSSTTQNLCSKCYRDVQHKEQQSISLGQTFLTSSAASSSNISASVSSSQPKVAEEKKSAAVQVQANKCTTCRRRVGLTGFKCRCGMTYCGTHRYPENHACGFDFKSVGKEQITKVNPVVKGEKLQKI